MKDGKEDELISQDDRTGQMTKEKNENNVDKHSMIEGTNI